MGASKRWRMTKEAWDPAGNVWLEVNCSVAGDLRWVSWDPVLGHLDQCAPLLPPATILCFALGCLHSFDANPSCAMHC